jgi:aspartate 1-decarboxylase
MFITLLKSKIHGATITDVNLKYEGSITVDEELMEKAKLNPYEKVHVLNLNNGTRIETYIIPGQRNSGKICLNGAAARSGCVGDKVIILSFCLIEEEKVYEFKPTIILVDEGNKIIKKAP